MIQGDIEANIDVYLAICSVTVTARELGAMGGTLANGGVNPHTGERALAQEHVRDVISVMSTCGMYADPAESQFGRIAAPDQPATLTAAAGPRATPPRAVGR